MASSSRNDPYFPAPARAGANWCDAPAASRLPERYDPGPEGYWRPDPCVREDVSERLSADDEVDARSITVTVYRGEVRLQGTVADHHCKRRATALARAVTGAREVKNHLRSCKSRLREWRDQLQGKAVHEHQGHAGGGTHNAPRPARSMR
jgi:BON domain